ncbi:MAG: hypothetical protein KAG53_11800 [Endozoicomonadaceae bacterium]|nr:hypothetical protein [Endozoicomonadaceae bacterium]
MQKYLHQTFGVTDWMTEFAECPVIIANIFYRIKIAFTCRQKSTDCSNQLNIGNAVPFANRTQGFLEWCLLIYGIADEIKTRCRGIKFGVRLLYFKFHKNSPCQ